MSALEVCFEKLICSCVITVRHWRKRQTQREGAESPGTDTHSNGLDKSVLTAGKVKVVPRLGTEFNENTEECTLESEAWKRLALPLKESLFPFGRRGNKRIE